MEVHHSHASISSEARNLFLQTHRLVEKNKRIRLTAARKTIEQLESRP